MQRGLLVCRLCVACVERVRGAILTRMSSELQQIEAAIAALESQRALIGDAVVDTALAPLREMRAALRAA